MATLQIKMEVCAEGEVYAIDEDEELTFSHTKVILKQDAQYYYAITKCRYGSIADVDPTKLQIMEIPNSHICPPFPPHFTRAPAPLTQTCHLKRAGLSYYGDPHCSDEPGRLLLDEAGVCEVLRKHPHPNIAQYLGCTVKDDTITGLCFVKYGEDLLTYAEKTTSFDRHECLRGITKGIKHLHHLGFIHCDINPHNIMMSGNTPIIIDFDSCRRTGEPLGPKGGTMGWTSESFTIAQEENDYYGISKIENWLLEMNEDKEC